MQVVTSANITAFPLLSRGKVRDIYDLGEREILIVTTDRISAFDVVMAEPVPYKGVVLNQLTLYWMRKFENIVPNHVLASDVANFPEALQPWREILDKRAIIARKAKPLPVECIVRGYLAGSAWSSYRKTGTVNDQPLPAGLRQSQQLAPPLFTPSTKAEAGTHDENISMIQCAALVGDEVAQKIRLLSLALYEAGAAHAQSRGILVADTKFEFGFIDGSIHLIDEVLTPDSSRFWPKAGYQPGHSQPSFDKQYLRDWLDKQNWNHEPPPPLLPEEVIKGTAQRYEEAWKILTNENSL